MTCNRQADFRSNDLLDPPGLDMVNPTRNILFGLRQDQLVGFEKGHVPFYSLLETITHVSQMKKFKIQRVAVTH